VQSHDINNKAIRAKIQAYMDSCGFPALWNPREYSFYFELMFGTDYAAQQKYLGEELATKKIALTVGHRQNAGTVADTDHSTWCRELFGPGVAAGTLKASDLAGYRNGPFTSSVRCTFRRARTRCAN